MATAAPISDEGREPWLVVWRKGVDGREMWRALCPTIGTGDEPDPVALLQSLAAPTPSSADAFLRSSAAQQLALNCNARYEQLFNGFAGACSMCCGMPLP